MSGSEVETVEAEDASTPSHQLLRAFITRVERLDDEIADLRSDRSDVLKEAKAAGFDGKAMTEVLRRRKMEPAMRDELDSLVAVYEEALHGQPRGMVWGGDVTPRPIALPPPKNDRERRALAALAAAEAAGMAERA